MQHLYQPTARITLCFVIQIPLTRVVQMQNGDSHMSEEEGEEHGTPHDTGDGDEEHESSHGGDMGSEAGSAEQQVSQCAGPRLVRGCVFRIGLKVVWLSRRRACLLNVSTMSIGKRAAAPDVHGIAYVSVFAGLAEEVPSPWPVHDYREANVCLA